MSKQQQRKRPIVQSDVHPGEPLQLNPSLVSVQSPQANGHSAPQLPQQAQSSRAVSASTPSTSLHHLNQTASTSNMPQFTSRDVADSTQRRNKQSMADLKLRRLTELNTRLREDLDRERIPVSQASNR